MRFLQNEHRFEQRWAARIALHTQSLGEQGGRIVLMFERFQGRLAGTLQELLESGIAGKVCAQRNRD